LYLVDKEMTEDSKMDVDKPKDKREKIRRTPWFVPDAIVSVGCKVYLLGLRSIGHTCSRI